MSNFRHCGILEKEKRETKNQITVLKDDYKINAEKLRVQYEAKERHLLNHYGELQRQSCSFNAPCPFLTSSESENPPHFSAPHTRQRIEDSDDEDNGPLRRSKRPPQTILAVRDRVWAKNYRKFDRIGYYSLLWKPERQQGRLFSKAYLEWLHPKYMREYPADHYISKTTSFVQYFRRNRYRLTVLFNELKFQ